MKKFLVAAALLAAAVTSSAQVGIWYEGPGVSIQVNPRFHRAPVYVVPNYGYVEPPRYHRRPPPPVYYEPPRYYAPPPVYERWDGLPCTPRYDEFMQRWIGCR